MALRWLLRLALYMPVLATAQQPATPPAVTSGAACVVAKQQGHSLASEWRVGARSVDTAIEHARRALRARGFGESFPQANSDLAHGWLMIVESS